MTTQFPPIELGTREEELIECRSAGRMLAQSITATRPHGHRGPKRTRDTVSRILAQARTSQETARAWLLDNVRLLQTADKEALEFSTGLHRFPVIADGRSGEVSRIARIAHSYLDQVQNRYSEETCAAFLDGFQSHMPLEMGEIWALKPALQTEILRRLDGAPADLWPVLVNGLRHVGETGWKELFESASLVHRELAEDPGGVYSRMD